MYFFTYFSKSNFPLYPKGIIYYFLIFFDFGLNHFSSLSVFKNSLRQDIRILVFPKKSIYSYNNCSFWCSISKPSSKLSMYKWITFFTWSYKLVFNSESRERNYFLISMPFARLIYTGTGRPNFHFFIASINWICKTVLFPEPA